MQVHISNATHRSLWKKQRNFLTTIQHFYRVLQARRTNSISWGEESTTLDCAIRHEWLSKISQGGFALANMKIRILPSCKRGKRAWRHRCLSQALLFWESTPFDPVNSYARDNIKFLNLENVIGDALKIYAVCPVEYHKDWGEQGNSCGRWVEKFPTLLLLW